MEIVPAMTSSNFECTSEIAVQTLMVQIVNGSRRKCVRAFIDTGSQRSYILASTAEEMEMTPVNQERVVHSLFGGHRNSVVVHNKFNILLTSMDSNYDCEAEVRSNNELCGGIPRIAEKIPGLIAELKKMNVTLSDVGHGSGKIELLIGADLYGSLITGRVERLKYGLVSIQTKLGWVLIGKQALQGGHDTVTTLHAMYVSDASLTQLWELETLGIRDPAEVKSKETMEMEAKQKLLATLSQTSEGNYCVRRSDTVLLPTNRDVAFKRLQAATRKLILNGHFEADDKIFKDWRNEHFIEKVPVSHITDRVLYLPHRAVVKVDSATTPVRPVFDASCRVGKATSLNDCLHKGINYIQLIPDNLIRFRENKIGFISDIRKAFQMIWVHPSDRDVLRFLWWEDNTQTKIVEWRHTRVIFGATCSPFILEAVIEHHLKYVKEEYSDIAEKLLLSLHVDNCVWSINTLEEYETFREKSVHLLKLAGMDLRLWESSLDLDNERKIISVLGVLWDKFSYELMVNVKGITIPCKATKRTVLSTIHRVFDPIGFVCPSLLPVKLLLQKLFIRKMKWDEDLPEKEEREFRKWCDQLDNLSKIRIPRHVTGGVVNRGQWTFHTFCDASKSAYGAVVFRSSLQNPE